MNFLVTGTARSGSTMLCRTLDQNPEISCLLELYNIEEAQKLDKINIFSSDSPKEVFNYIKQKDLKKTIYGFKMLYYTSEAPYLPKNVIDNLIKTTDKIITIKRNLLHSYISDTIAEKTNKWWNQKNDSTKIIFKFNDFADYYRTKTALMCNLQKKINSYNKPNLIVSYNNIRNMVAFANIEKFLGAKKWGQYKLQGIKQTSDFLYKKVQNYDEMVNQIKQSPFETLI